MAYKNLVGKGENAGKPAFSPFAHKVFYAFKENLNHPKQMNVICKCFEFGPVCNFVMG